MNRRDLIRATAAAAALPVLSACGSGGNNDDGASPVITALSADKTSYFVGDTAILSATFSGGAGQIDPGARAITSGVPLSVPIAQSTTFRLTVTAQGVTPATRDLAVTAAYRNTIKTVALGDSRDSHVQLTMSDNRVMVIGGESLASTLPTLVLRYDPTTETFVANGNLLTGRIGHTASPVTATKVMVFGGQQGLTQAPIAELYDTQTGVSLATAVTPSNPRTEHTATVLRSGQVLVVGGSSGSVQLDTADLYDPIADSFIRLSSRLATARSGHAAMLLSDGSVLIYGGRTQNGRTAPPERYDPALQGFTAFASPSFDLDPRLFPAITTLAGGDVLVIGGETNSGTPIASIVRVSITAAVPNFLSYGSLSVARARAAAATLTDGRVIVAGGNVDGSSRGIATTELIGTDARISAGPALSTGRSFLAATTTSTGKVLMSGGLDTTDTVTATADLLG